MILEDLKTLLSGNAGITAVINDRLIDKQVPDDVTEPAIAVAQTDDDRDQGIVGGGSYKQSQFKIDCVASATDVANDLAEKVKALIEPLTGAMGGTDVRNSLIYSACPLYKTGRTTVRIEFFIFWNPQA